MQLEIKHLHPYLLHKLKVQYFGNMIGQADSYRVQDWKNPLRVLYNDAGDKNELYLKLTDIKPILWPLSDLPNYSNGIMHRGYKTDKASIENIISDIRAGVAGYDIMQMCFEEHIDVFGLINAGLAVDANTVDLKVFEK